MEATDDEIDGDQFSGGKGNTGVAASKVKVSVSPRCGEIA